MGRLTWTRPDGCWGIKGVDLAALPPKVYAALCKLKSYEDAEDELTAEEKCPACGGPAQIFERHPYVRCCYCGVVHRILGQ